jgi:ABC-type amino acid transport substrate-binding protein
MNGRSTIAGLYCESHSFSSGYCMAGSIRHFTLVVLVITICLGVPFTLAVPFERSLSAAVYTDLPPYSFLNDEGQPSGIHIEFFEVLAQNLEAKIDYKVRPHGRIIAELIAGDVDMALMLVIPGEIALPMTRSVAVMPYPIMEVPLNLYFNANRSEPIQYPKSFTLLSDLKGLRVGFLRAGASDAHTSLHEKEGVVYFNSNESMVKSLLANRVDMVLMDPFSVDYWSSNLSASLKPKYFLVKAAIHIAFSRNTLGESVDSLCAQSWKNLLDLKNRDELQEIFIRYGYEDLMQYIIPRTGGLRDCQTINEVMAIKHPAL